MSVIVVVLGDQLSEGLGSLAAVARGEAVVLMAEVAEEATYVLHHKQKLVLVFSAMRHFAAGLAADGWRVDYRRLDGPDTRASLGEEVAAAVSRHGATRVVSVQAGEHRLRTAQAGWSAAAGVPVELLEDDRFLVREGDFAAWAEGRRGLRMEDFYRWQRRETGILMAGGVPVGGQWNFDRENRKRLPKGVAVPGAPHFAPDGVTREVMVLVEARFGDNFGTLERFGWPVTRGQALEALRRFVDERLRGYGDFQDAMAEGQATLFHALISTSMNLGLLDPRECIDAGVAALEDGAPLNAVEGFVRQILGWREFVRAVYFREGPDYVTRNELGAGRDLPAFFWEGGSGMRCFDAAFAQTRDLAYAHHIQRLMVLGNFALLAGVDPAQVQEWFLLVYADAYEWVEAPNVAGMSQYADGGVIASKPYAAGGAYIDRMSDHCGRCQYSPKVKSGPGACPYSLLYWDFVARHEERFARNPRMWTVVQGWRRMTPERQAELRGEAAGVLARL